MILYKIEIGHPNTEKSTKKYYTSEKQFTVNLKRTKEKFKRYNVNHVVIGHKAKVTWKKL